MAAEAIGWVTLVTFVESSALTLLRIGGTKQLIGASLIYGLGVIPLLSKSLQYEGIGMVNFFWNVLKHNYHVCDWDLLFQREGSKSTIDWHYFQFTRSGTCVDLR